MPLHSPVAGEPGEGATSPGSNGIRRYVNPYLDAPVSEVGACSVCRHEIKIDRTTGTLVEHKVTYPGPRCGGSGSVAEVVAVTTRV